MTQIQSKSISIGQIKISDEVIATIAGTAANEVDGVVTTNKSFSDDSNHKKNKLRFSKDIKVVFEHEKIKIDVNIKTKFGSNIQEVCANVQSKIKTALETMTGLVVGEVNVNVTGVIMLQEKTK